MTTYRYFYNNLGAIVGQARFKKLCLVTTIADSVGWVDSDQLLPLQQYRYDFVLEQLVKVTTD
jgi:hypothetical protein